MIETGCFTLLFLVATQAAVILDTLSLEDFVLIEADIPTDDPFCALTPGHNRLLLGFDGTATNTGLSDVHEWHLDWLLECEHHTRAGSIHFGCLNDYVCEVERYASCAVSGVSAGCKTHIRPMPCDFIDVTGGVTGCNLTLDGQIYEIGDLELEADVFWQRFILCLLFFVGISSAAFIDSCLARRP
jgi:hypothetical protein